MVGGSVGSFPPKDDSEVESGSLLIVLDEWLSSLDMDEDAIGFVALISMM